MASVTFRASVSVGDQVPSKAK